MKQNAWRGSGVNSEATIIYSTYNWFGNVFFLPSIISNALVTSKSLVNFSQFSTGFTSKFQPGTKLKISCCVLAEGGGKKKGREETH